MVTATNKIWINAVLVLLLTTIYNDSVAQATLLQDYENTASANIGTFQGIAFREAGFSGLYPIANSNGKEFWTVSDRGVNVDAANANSAECRPTYDKIYGFANYAPKIHRIRINGSSIEILQTITIKRPDGTNASGLLNPTGFGSTAAELVSTDTVQNCANFNLKIAAKDIWGIDSEGIVVDPDGNFWICEEGGPTIWKVAPSGIVIARYSPYADLPGAEVQDILIDTAFRYRKNNRGFEGISITPNGKIYAIIQSPLLYPTKSVGEGTRLHRIIEIDPSDNSTRMFVYVNDGIIGTGGNQIRLRDWKIGDMAAIDNNSFLVLEAAARGTSDIKHVYKIDLTNATPVVSGSSYGGVTLEALVDETGLANNGIVPVQKTLFMDLLTNGWNPILDKAEGIAIIDQHTIAIVNDNDYGQSSPAENGIATATGKNSHMFVYHLEGENVLSNYVPVSPAISQGVTAFSTSTTPYLNPTVEGGIFTSMLTVGDNIEGYRMVGVPDGLGAYDNNDGTFTLLMNHELGNTVGITRAHGGIGAFVSKWIVSKSDLTVMSGSDLIQTTYLWNSTTNTYVQNTTSFNRFCSADLAPESAFYNSESGLGTTSRIFLNGEEAGNEGRAFAHIASGADIGKSYQLPRIGKYSFENALASSHSGDKTVVIGTDDSTPGQVYVYVGTKTSSGTEVDKAGLTNGSLYGIAVSGYPTEVNETLPAAGTAFTLASLGNVENTTGADLQTQSNIAGVTNFLRPEDGSWDPSYPNDFYFATTNAFTAPTRLWRLRFSDVKHPELGGTIEAVLDGTEGPKMMDNITIDKSGHILIVEDVGNQAHLGRTWQYTIATDHIKQIAVHDANRFVAGAAGFLTQDEESSGVLDVQEILGAGMFLIDVQAHYPIPGELAEGGQLLAYFNPDSFNDSEEIAVTGNGIEIMDGDINPSTLDITDLGNVTIGTAHTSTFEISNTGELDLTISSVSFTGPDAASFTATGISLPWNIAPGGTQSFDVTFSAAHAGINNAVISITNSDATESVYDFALLATAICTPLSTTQEVNACGSYNWHGATYTETGTYSFVSTNDAGCPVNETLNLTMDTFPATPATISGPVSVCAFIGNDLTATYSVPATAGITYLWTAPMNATIESGQGSATVHISFAENFMNGHVRVKATNTCGLSANRTLFVAKAAPAMPLAINGSSNACPGDVVSYSISPVAYATEYTWTAPAGASITSGQGTTSVEITYNENFGNSGLVKVSASNACGTSNQRNKSVSRSIPAKPAMINGYANGNCETTTTYTIAEVDGMTYNWTAPAGTTIINGQGTSMVEVSFSESFVTGTLSVTATNGCGTSSSRTLSLYARPGTPAAIDGINDPCKNSMETYSIDELYGVTTYEWTVPYGSVIQAGQGTSSIDVLIGNNPGLVKVRGINDCAQGYFKSLPIHPASCEARSIEMNDPIAIGINVYPNPTSGILNIQFGSDESTPCDIVVMDITGKTVFREQVIAMQGENNFVTDISSFPGGVYMLRLSSSSFSTTVRVVKD